MAGAAGLFLALVCMAIVGVGLALAITAWRPRPGDDAVFAVAFTAGIAVACGSFLLAALHWLAHLLI